MKIRKLVLGSLSALALAAFAVVSRTPAEAPLGTHHENSPGIGTQQVDSHGIVTTAADLSGFSLGDLHAKNADPLAPFIEKMLSQVEQARPNLGGSGPPGLAA